MTNIFKKVNKDLECINYKKKRSKFFFFFIQDDVSVIRLIGKIQISLLAEIKYKENRFAKSLYELSISIFDFIFIYV